MGEGFECARHGLAVKLHGRPSWVIRVEQAPRSGRRCWRAGHSLGGKAVLQYLRGCAADSDAFPVPEQVCAPCPQPVH
jgi:hypothetical protein